MYYNKAAAYLAISQDGISLGFGAEPLSARDVTSACSFELNDLTRYALHCLLTSLHLVVVCYVFVVFGLDCACDILFKSLGSVRFIF